MKMIFFSSINFKVIDESGNVCETYPASTDTYPQTAPIGTKSEGEEAYGLKQQSSKIVDCRIGLFRNKSYL